MQVFPLRQAAAKPSSCSSFREQSWNGSRGTWPEQAAAHHSSQAANHEAVFPLRHFHCWIAVVRCILGPLYCNVHQPSINHWMKFNINLLSAMGSPLDDVSLSRIRFKSGSQRGIRGADRIHAPPENLHWAYPSRHASRRRPGFLIARPIRPHTLLAHHHVNSSRRPIGWLP